MRFGSSFLKIGFIIADLSRPGKMLVLYPRFIIRVKIGAMLSLQAFSILADISSSPRSDEICFSNFCFFNFVFPIKYLHKKALKY